MTKEELIEKCVRESGGYVEAGVNEACRRVLVARGIAPGVRVRVEKGRWKGIEGVVDVVNWTECEFQIKVEGGLARNRWFSLWHDTRFVTVLD